MLPITILGVSIVLQFVAAVLAFSLIRITGWRWAWLLIAAALALMGIRRVITFYDVVVDGTPTAINLPAELVALAISVLMVLGAFLIRPVFARLQRTQTALRESEERFRAIVDNSLNGITMKDADGNFLFVNRTYAEWMKAAPQDIVGKTVFDFFPAAAAAEINDADRQVVSRRHRVVGELKRPFRDGVTRDLLNYRIPVELAAGKRPAVITIMTDLTKFKETEEALHQARKLEAVGRLTGGVAHDFNNLLAIIQGNLGLLADETRMGACDAARLDAFIQPALSATRRGAALVQRLLSFSRRQTLRFEPVDVPALIAGMGDLLRHSLGETIETQISAAPGAWLAYADSGQLENAILNLAINARDAMPSGGTLTVKVVNVTLTEDDIEPQWEGRPGDYVALRVSDTGTGMPPDIVDRAFEPFFTTKDIGEGSGLGLSMVYGFAQQSGGFTTLQSTEGVGTTVTLYLPKARTEQRAAARREDDADLKMGRGETVLLVEDDPEVRAVTKAMLESLDYSVLTAESGAAALEAIADHGPVDLLLTDLILPGGMNGVEICRHLRGRQPGLKCILVTGYSSPTTDETLPEGAKLLGKPVDYNDLARHVRQTLDS